jgi:hypothetical protein
MMVITSERHSVMVRWRLRRGGQQSSAPERFKEQAEVVYVTENG